MVKHNLRTFAFIIIGFALITWGILVWIHHGFKFEKISVGDFGQISAVVSINVILWGFFIKYCWKWWIFKGWLIQSPNLSGKWVGETHSNWINGDGETIGPIATTVIITQSLLHINIKVETKEMTSNSAAASLDIDEERGYKNLWYSYRSEPIASVRGRSAIHYGSVLLKINDNNSELRGQYWTDRKSTGDIILHKVIPESKSWW